MFLQILRWLTKWEERSVLLPQDLRVTVSRVMVDNKPKVDLLTLFNRQDSGSEGWGLLVRGVWCGRCHWTSQVSTLIFITSLSEEESCENLANVWIRTLPSLKILTFVISLNGSNFSLVIAFLQALLVDRKLKRLWAFPVPDLEIILRVVHGLSVFCSFILSNKQR